LEELAEESGLAIEQVEEVRHQRAALVSLDQQVGDDGDTALGDLLPWMIAQLEHGVVHTTNPRYFGLFNPAPSFPALCGDRLTGAFNPQLATATTSPAAVELESHVIRAIARRAGLPAESTGHFTSGGSEANYTAVLCALTRANGGFASEGARAFSGPPVFYISRESHLAWVKIGHHAGIGRTAVRQVRTDGTGRMDTDALAAMLDEDTARGWVPFLIVATAGTTNAGMIDPIGRCADIARERGLWLHVDAAWGGAVLASERLHGALAGIERANSVTIDAHKLLLQLNVGDDVLARRRAKWVRPPPKFTRGVLAKYMRLVSTASRGAVTDLGGE
jgi:glutamate/tyrosine decarboxylase-like PLP-dependent enzyme